MAAFFASHSERFGGVYTFRTRVIGDRVFANPALPGRSPTHETENRPATCIHSAWAMLLVTISTQRGRCREALQDRSSNRTWRSNPGRLCLRLVAVAPPRPTLCAGARFMALSEYPARIGTRSDATLVLEQPIDAYRTDRHLVLNHAHEQSFRRAVPHPRGVCHQGPHRTPGNTRHRHRPGGPCPSHQKAGDGANRTRHASADAAIWMVDPVGVAASGCQRLSPADIAGQWSGRDLRS